MILLDTNVVSELMRPAPNVGVISFLDSYPVSDVWISAITVAEIYMGIALLPEGKRKAILYAAAEQMFIQDFSGRCLPFDCQAGLEYARIIKARREAGRPVSVEDAQIAAVSAVGGLVLVTRNTRDFFGIAGLALINPFRENGGN
ncbi:MAG: type II toxin-antitoxin system VapC family toxin [Thermodesulfobacteriota bacterium]